MTTTCRCGHGEPEHFSTGGRVCAAGQPDRCSCAGYRPAGHGHRARRRRWWVYWEGYRAQRDDSGNRATALVIYRAPRPWWLVGKLNDWAFAVARGFGARLFDAIDQAVEHRTETFDIDVPQTVIEKFSMWRGWVPPYWIDQDMEKEHTHE